MSKLERVATQLITQEVLAQLAEAVGVEVPLSELLAGGVTQKTLSYRVDTFQRYLVDHFLNSVRDLARLKSLLSMPKAREFPSSIPKVHAGTFSQSDEWRVNVLYSLGQDIFPPAPSAPPAATQCAPQAIQRSILRREDTLTSSI